MYVFIRRQDTTLLVDYAYCTTSGETAPAPWPSYTCSIPVMLGIEVFRPLNGKRTWVIRPHM